MKNSIQSVERAFKILKVVHRQPNGIGVGELAAETGLHTSTASRMVSTLEHVGALERVGGKLIIGESIVALANRAPWTERLIGLATPCLRELAADTQEAVGLTKIEGNECIVFYQIPSSHHIQIRDWTEERFPLHTTSSGKLYLAELDEPALEKFFKRPLAKIAPQTKTRAAELRQEFEQIRREGVAWTIDELEEGLTSVGATIADENGRFLAGLYVSIPSYRVGDKDTLAAQVRTAAAQISHRLSE